MSLSLEPEKAISALLQHRPHPHAPTVLEGGDGRLAAGDFISDLILLLKKPA